VKLIVSQNHEFVIYITINDLKSYKINHLC